MRTLEIEQKPAISAIKKVKKHQLIQSFQCLFARDMLPMVL